MAKNGRQPKIKSNGKINTVLQMEANKRQLNIAQRRAKFKRETKKAASQLMAALQSIGYRTYLQASGGRILVRPKKDGEMGMGIPEIAKEFGYDFNYNFDLLCGSNAKKGPHFVAVVLERMSPDALALSALSESLQTASKKWQPVTVKNQKAA